MKWINKYFEKANIPGTSFFFGEYFLILTGGALILFTLSVCVGFNVFKLIK